MIVISARDRNFRPLAEIEVRAQAKNASRAAGSSECGQDLRVGLSLSRGEFQMFIVHVVRQFDSGLGGLERPPPSRGPSPPA